MAIFTPLPTPPGLPPILQPNSGPNKSPPGSSADNYNPDILSQQQATAIWDSDNNPVYFPTSSIQEQNSHSIVPHLYPNLDNGLMENTGFNPRHWNIIIPLTDNIYPANNEKWIAGKLYNTYADLKAIFRDGFSHRLDLPMESVLVKVESWTFTESGEKPRDGIIVNVNFTECLDDRVDQAAENYFTGTPLSQTTSVANVMEGEYVRLTYFNPPGLSLQGLFTQVASFIRQAVAYPNNIVANISAQTNDLVSTAGGAVSALITAPAVSYNQAITVFNQNKNTILGAIKQTNAITYDQLTLANLHTSFQSLVNTQSINATSFTIKAVSFNTNLLKYYSALKVIQTTPMQQAILTNIGLLQAIYKQLQSQSVQHYQTLSFVNNAPITFMQVARRTNNNIEQIMQLNPNLTSLMVIPINSQIKYFSATGN